MKHKIENGTNVLALLQQAQAVEEELICIRIYRATDPMEILKKHKCSRMGINWLSL